MNCSDSHLAYVCSQCGSLISVYPTMDPNIIGANSYSMLRNSSLGI